MGLVHQHLLVRAEVSEPIVSVEVAKEWLVKLVDEIGMVITKSGGPHVDYVDKPGNAGIAGIVMIETSHCALHIWDQLNPPLVQLDVYSCSQFDENKVLKMLESMKPTKVNYFTFDRSQESPFF